ncbi:MAG: hypothetical protein OJF62_002047 [Pseudolabrys sp.]|nr:hypothetical protein [Pseudolabrys sp.]
MAITTRDDESPAFWRRFPFDDLVQRVATLHAERNQWNQKFLSSQIEIARLAVSSMLLPSGADGIEVGAGARPFPLPAGVTCFYGDHLDHDGLVKYFNSDIDHHNGFIDAESFTGIAQSSADFVVMAHVIEHLQNPLGSIQAAIGVLKPGGVLIMAAPDRRHTFDRRRPGTTLDHILKDFADGGRSTRKMAYLEHLRFVYPELTGNTFTEAEIEQHAEQSTALSKSPDCHFHAWNDVEFRGLCEYAAAAFGALMVGSIFVVNENIAAMRKLP